MVNIQKVIVMSSYKDILKRIGKYVGYAVLFLCSLIIIGIVAGFFIYAFLDKDCDKQFIAGCMFAGLSKEVCQDKLYH